jgi:hypothetical protein
MGIFWVIVPVTDSLKLPTDLSNPGTSLLLISGGKGGGGGCGGGGGGLGGGGGDAFIVRLLTSPSVGAGGADVKLNPDGCADPRDVGVHSRAEPTTETGG